MLGLGARRLISTCHRRGDGYAARSGCAGTWLIHITSRSGAGPCSGDAAPIGSLDVFQRLSFSGRFGPFDVPARDHPFSHRIGTSGDPSEEVRACHPSCIMKSRWWCVRPRYRFPARSAKEPGQGQHISTLSMPSHDQEWRSDALPHAAPHCNPLVVWPGGRSTIGRFLVRASHIPYLAASVA